MKLRYKDYKIETVAVPSDGDCLLHAILISYYIPYLQAGKRERKQIVTQLREKLASELPEHYKKLLGGNLAHMAESLDEFKLKNMQRQLRSGWLGYGYIEYLSNYLEKDIYIIDEQGKLYWNDENKYAIKKRTSIIIQYNGIDHYEAIRLRRGEEIKIHFCPNHSLIQKLRASIVDSS